MEYKLSKDLYKKDIITKLIDDIDSQIKLTEENNKLIVQGDSESLLDLIDQYVYVYNEQH